MSPNELLLSIITAMEDYYEAKKAFATLLDCCLIGELIYLHDGMIH